MGPKIKVYRGYANQREITVCGHVFQNRTHDDFTLSRHRLHHARTILGLFNMKTVGNIPVVLRWRNMEVRTRTLGDGYFSFTIPFTEDLESGWHTCQLAVPSEEGEVTEQAEFIKPHPGEFGLISDIDDTFLISHSNNLIKKLYVLLTRNVEKRRIFSGVVQHYRLLSEAGRNHPEAKNVFFYVSSSEWNLYNLIDEFTRIHEFPKAILKLKRIKTGPMDFLYSGTGDHDHKFHKIKHLLEFYPELKFILLGDDSQEDPKIYERIAKMFPISLAAIYIRQTGRRPKASAARILENIATLDLPVCYFSRTADAIHHSESIGLIQKN